VLVARNKDELEKTAADIRSGAGEAVIHDLGLSEQQSGNTVVRG